MKNYVIKTIVYMDENKGIKSSRVNDDNIVMLSFRKNNILTLKDSSMLKRSGIYLLVNNSETGADSIYVGQTSDISNRIYQHLVDETKEFQDVIAFVHCNDSLSKTYIDYLEYHYIHKALNQNSFICINKDEKPNKPKANEEEIILIQDIIDKIDQLLIFNGINLEKVDSSTTKAKINTYNYLGGKLLYSDGEFYLLKDSIISNKQFSENDYASKQDINSYARITKWREENREFLLKQGDSLVITRDIKVNSCSLAACIVKGYKALNGWDAWKNNGGNSLDEMRKK